MLLGFGVDGQERILSLVQRSLAQKVILLKHGDKPVGRKSRTEVLRSGSIMDFQVGRCLGITVSL